MVSAGTQHLGMARPCFHESSIQGFLQLKEISLNDAISEEQHTFSLIFRVFVSYFVERLAFLQESGSREVVVKPCYLCSKRKRNLDLSKASKALDCFSQRICRTLMAVAGLSPPPCDHETKYQRSNCLKNECDGPLRMDRILLHCQMI